MCKCFFMVLSGALIFTPLTLRAQTTYSASNYPKWRAIGGIPAIRVYSVKDTNGSAPSKVNVSTLDAGAFGLSYGIYTRPETGDRDTTVTGGIFDVSLDLLFFVSPRNSRENITFAPPLALGLGNNKLEFVIGF